MLLAGVRRRPAEEEGESVFVSMTDLTVSFLFIILILLAFFATQFKPDEMVPRDRYEAVVRDLSGVRTELTTARERMRELEASLAIVRRKIDDLEREWRVLNARLTGANRTIASLRASVDGLKRSLAEALATQQALSARVDALERDLEGTRVERDAALQQVAELEDEVSRLRRLLSDREWEVGRLKLRIANLESPDQLAAYLQDVSRARDALLERITERIRQQLPGILVTVDTAAGVIRFRGDDLFEPGRWRIESGSAAHRMSLAVADALADTLPCYTQGPRSAFYVTCNSAFALIETIQVEGHTDNDPLSPTTRARENMVDNYDLSARRGAETLRFINRHRPEIGEFLNRRVQPVLSFAGYGKTRPIAPGQTERAKAANRRIDIRFILDTPKSLREVEEIRNRLIRDRPVLPPIANEDVP